MKLTNRELSILKENGIVIDKFGRWRKWTQETKRLMVDNRRKTIIERLRRIGMSEEKIKNYFKTR